MRRTESTNSGQIIVLLALVMVGLIGFTALAVDGGMVYADRRNIQSAADAISLAGAGRVGSDLQSLGIKNGSEWDCNTKDPNKINLDLTGAYQEAIDNGAINKFSIGIDPQLGSADNHHGIVIKCYPDKGYVDVFVMLTQDTPTTFARLFTNKPITNVLTSITRVNVGITAGNGNTIVSMSKNCKPNADGIWISGSNSTRLFKGGLWSNSCISRKGAANLEIEQGGVTYYQDSWAEGITEPIPQASESYHPLTGKEMIPNIGEHCSKTDPYIDFDSNKDGDTISPGNYKDLTIQTAVRFNYGFYCIKGVINYNANGYIDMTPQSGSPSDGVTIYYTGTDLTINGGSSTELAAPNGYSDGETSPSGAIEDVLLYIPLGVKATVKINGGSNNTFAGTMYMPSSEVTINGTSDNRSPTTMRVSMIGYSIKINGDSNIEFIYDIDRDYPWPATLEVHK